MTPTPPARARTRATGVVAALVLLLASLASPGQAGGDRDAGRPARVAQADVTVDVALVLAVDSSASVDFTEFNLQLQGLALAFRDPQLAESIAQGPHGSIAVALIEWSSQDMQQIAIPWTRVAGEADAQALADRIDATPRRINTGATSISSAILFAAQMLRTAPFLAERHVIDVSGDGYNNQGPVLSRARDLVVEQGVTINALGIENQVLGLTDYFRDSLIGGFGAFAIRAEDYQDYTGQIRRKLLRELAPPPVSRNDGPDALDQRT